MILKMGRNTKSSTGISHVLEVFPRSRENPLISGTAHLVDLAEVEWSSGDEGESTSISMYKV